MSSLYDYDTFLSYLFELESALSRIGLQDCQDLKADTQLSAAIYALLRAGCCCWRIPALLRTASLCDTFLAYRRRPDTTA